MYVHPAWRAYGAAICAIALALLNGSGVSARQATTPHWLVADATRHTVTVTVIAGYSGANDGLNFNGDANGKLVISVPAGYRVTVAFASKGAFPHNAVITSTKPTGSSDAFALAFPGSGPEDTTTGVISARYSFRTTKVGSYYIVCGLPGHAATGMWGRFIVTRGGRPKVTV
jgi:sulfocyanin